MKKRMKAKVIPVLKVMSKNDLENIKNSISRYLSMREHSKSELAEKLLKKNYQSELIIRCIDEFTEKGLQSDYRYAESYIRSKFNDHKGENFIKLSLKNKGISTDLINKIMQGYDDQAWLKQAISALEKKVYKDDLNESDQKKKQNAFLNSRGNSGKGFKSFLELKPNVCRLIKLLLCYKLNILIKVINIGLFFTMSTKFGRNLTQMVNQ